MEHRNISRVTRRDFLRATGVGFGLLTAAPLLAACATATPPPAEPAPTAAPVEAAPAIEDNLPGPEQANIDWRQFEGTELRWLGGLHPFAVAVEKMVPEFQELTGIKVTVEQIAWDAYQQKTMLDLGSPDPQYDCFLCNGFQFNWRWGPTGLISEVHEFLEDPNLTDKEWYDLEDVDPKIVAAATWDGVPGHKAGTGNLYVVPFMSETFILAYRDDLFQKYGLEAPTTVEEIIPAAEAIYEGEGGQIPGFSVRGGTYGVVNACLINWLPNYGADTFDEGMNCLLAEEPSVYVHDLLINQILKEYGPEGWPGLQWDDMRHKFADGQYGMIFDCDYFSALYEDPAQSKMAGNIRYGNLGSAESKYVDYYYFGTAINANSKNKKAAWLLEEFLTSKKAMRDVTVKHRNLMPTRFSTFSDPGFEEMVGGWGQGTWLEATRANLEKWGRGAFTPNDQQEVVNQIWAGGTVKMYEGAPVQDTLVAVSEEVNALMDKAGYRKPSS